ncbi:hypothetical protein CDAR_4721 [Caerostris darwini]|uniref:Ribosomal protein S14 n=1 Tax=Caerostris darwini TaxID=1538125 RepID=A0AAV4P559_9ARAC|nr:hypothetical protein CDAR_4721 [Caerostris darwini]
MHFLEKRFSPTSSHPPFPLARPRHIPHPFSPVASPGTIPTHLLLQKVQLEPHPSRRAIQIKFTQLLKRRNWNDAYLKKREGNSLKSENRLRSTCDTLKLDFLRFIPFQTPTLSLSGRSKWGIIIDQRESMSLINLRLKKKDFYSLCMSLVSFYGPIHRCKAGDGIQVSLSLGSGPPTPTRSDIKFPNFNGMGGL